MCLPLGIGVDNVKGHDIPIFIVIGRLVNYIKQLRLMDILHWTPLFSKEKFHTIEYDIPLDRVGHW